MKNATGNSLSASFVVLLEEVRVLTNLGRSFVCFADQRVMFLLDGVSRRLEGVVGIRLQAVKENGW